MVPGPRGGRPRRGSPRGAQRDQGRGHMHKVYGLGRGLRPRRGAGLTAAQCEGDGGRGRGGAQSRQKGRRSRLLGRGHKQRAGCRRRLDRAWQLPGPRYGRAHEGAGRLSRTYAVGVRGDEREGAGARRPRLHTAQDRRGPGCESRGFRAGRGGRRQDRRGHRLRRAGPSPRRPAAGTGAHGPVRGNADASPPVRDIGGCRSARVGRGDGDARTGQARRYNRGVR